ncbi:MAG: hypothetical protein AB7I19_04665 [Planctomycetota bacterium]
MSPRESILDRLPMSNAELAALEADPTVSPSDLEFARAASRHIAALRALPAAPAVDWSAVGSDSVGRNTAAPRPSASRGPKVTLPGLEALHESIADESAARLPGSVKAILSQPLTPPREIDWSAAVLDHLQGSPLRSRPDAVGRAISPPSHATPGWLWQRIRGDVKELRSRTRRVRGAWVAMAASLMLGVWAATILLGPDRSERTSLTISFQRVDQPFVSGFSTGSILAEVRRGSR